MVYKSKNIDMSESTGMGGSYGTKTDNVSSGKAYASAISGAKEGRQISGANIIIESLAAHGVDTVFGYPGGQILDLYDELYRNTDRITHYLSCHEQGAAHAADGYARATGRVGVVIATSGPGATNLVTGIATAYLDSVPLIAITGNVATKSMGKDSFQEVDITGITMPVTKHNYLVKRVEDLEQVLYEAFQVAQSGRPGPVLIDIPKDVQVNKAAFRGGAPLPLFIAEHASDEAIAQAAELINSSKRPYIYGGGGIIAANAAGLLREFANRINAPVGLSMMGLGAMSKDDPLYLGLTGMHGLAQSISTNSKSDLIIGIGVRFSDRATGDIARYSANTKILHIDIDDAEIDKNVKSTASVLGDLRDILPRLAAKVEPQTHIEWTTAVVDEHVRMRAARQLESTMSVQPMSQNLSWFTPQEVIAVVNAHTHDDTVIVTDVGQHQMWVAQNYDFCRPRSFLTSGGLGTMGYGLGAAIGASLAKESKPARTVLFTSDGSFHMNLNELACAVSNKLPIVIVIMNNGALGMVRQWQSHFYGERYFATSPERQTDYVKLAQAFGARGAKPSTIAELEEILVQAFTDDRQSDIPMVIDCAINPNAKVLPIVPPGGFFDDAILED